MATLHTVNKSPFERNSLTSCLRFATTGSAVLLLEDAVVGALQGTAVAQQLTDAMSSIAIYALGPDLQARGIKQGQVLDGIRVVDYGGFVDLTTEHDRVQAWL